MARPKGIKARDRQKKAGAANLAKWKDEQGNPEPNRKHGAYSTTIRQRYSDLRTTEGKKLKAVIDSVLEDLGGAPQINAAQQVLLGSFRGKLIVLFQISDYLDRQQSIINKDGYILPVLGQTYLSYSESVRRDLETLYGLSKSQLRRKVPKLEEIINK
jgi:hypothetical protein